MVAQVLMPALSPTMERGTLAKWLVGEGDSVKSGDVIAEIETDKATMEVEAVDEGRLGKILVAEGSKDVPVNALLALLLEDGEDESDLVSHEVRGAPSVPVSGQGGNERSDSGASLSSHGTHVHREVNGKGDQAMDRSVDAGQVGASVVDPHRDGQCQRMFVSPLARRYAGEYGIDLNSVKGSGPRGRIVMRDVEGMTSSPRKAGHVLHGAVASSRSAMPVDDQIKDMYPEGSYRELEHDGMRRVIAARLTESKQTVPHFYLSADCRLDDMLALRLQLNDAAMVDSEGVPHYKLSVNDFIVKALALALRDLPMANVTWTEGSRLLHGHVDLGVAIAVPDGLFTPIVRKAEMKPLSVISSEIKDFARRARGKKLKPEEYQGGVSSVSNLGMYGVREFGAVINPPQSTILAVGAAESRPVVSSDGTIVAAQMMSVTLSCDHRVVDGALGAELLRMFKSLIENPVRILV